MNEPASERQDGIVLGLAMQMLRSFGELRPVVRGASMLPSIFPGDVLIIQPETARGARCGDVVLFFRDGRFCAHRLVDRREQRGHVSLITQGDALRRNDPPVGEDELLGRVTAVIRGRKRIELDGPLPAHERLFRWIVRHSATTTKWLLRWHFLRAGLAHGADGVFPAIPSKPLELA